MARTTTSRAIAAGRPGCRRRARRSTRRPRWPQIEKALEAGGAPDHTRIWAMLETPIAMLATPRRSRRARERLAVLVMGTNDLAKELHAEHVPGRQPLLVGLGLCLLGRPRRPAR